MLMSALPLSVIAAEADVTPTCADISMSEIIVDGRDTEGWSDIDYSLLDTAFDGCTPTAVGRQSKVRIATDGLNLYVYYESLGDNLGSEPLLYIYFRTPSMTETKRCVVYLKDPSKGFYTNQLRATKAVQIDDGLITAEIMIPLRDIDRMTLRTENIGNSWIGILERYEITGGGMALSSSFGWGADSQFVIPQIDPIEDLSEGLSVSNAAGNTVSVDGVRGEDEGWAELPYMVLDTPMYGADASVITADSKLWLSTDGQNLYVFLESCGKAHGAKPALYLNILFDGFSKMQEIGVELKDGNTAFWRWRCNDTEQTAYVSSAKERASVMVKVGEVGTTAELSIPLPDTERGALRTGESVIKMGALERFDLEGGDAGMAAADGSECFGWNASLSVTLPVVNTVSKVADAHGKRITVNGAMGSAEGWAVMPYTVLSATTADGSTVSGKANLEYSNIRYSADTSKIYVFFETYNMSSERLYLQFAFDGAEAGVDSKGDFLTVELNIAPDAETVISSLSYADGVYYSSGDEMFDGTVAAVRQMSARYCVELCVPIPEHVVKKRLDEAVTVKVGAYERFSADAANGYISPAGYNAASPTEAILLERDSVAVGERLIEWLEKSKETADHEYLRGLSVNVFGDSYFTGGGLDGGYTWAGMLATKYGWILNNYAEGNDMMSTYGGIDSMPMVKRYRQLPNNAPDLVIVTGGYYDWINNVPLGKLGSRDTATYFGALGAVVDGAKSKYPESTVVFVTPWNFEGKNGLSLTYKDYADAMVTVCEEKGVYCYRGHESETSSVNMQSAVFRAQYCLSESDSYHLNLEGMKLAMPKVEEYLNATMNHWWSSYTPDDGDYEDESTSDLETLVPEETGGDDENNTDGNDPLLTIIAVVITTVVIVIAAISIFTVITVIRKKNQR